LVGYLLIIRDGEKKMTINSFLFITTLLSVARLGHYFGFKSGLEQGKQVRQEEIKEEK
jgi:hypothetical protein